MMEQKRDEQLQTELGEYLDGVEKPNVDLGQAKAELQNARVRRKRRTIRSAVLSACSVAACALIVAVAVLPTVFRSGKNAADSGNDNYGDNNMGSSPQEPAFPSEERVYSLAELSEREADFEEISERFGPFDSDAAVSDETLSYRFSVCTLEGEEILLRTELTAEAFTATVYTDLSDGRYTAEELQPFRSLPKENGYRILTEKVGGEYRSSVYWVSRAETFAVVLSPSEEGIEVFLNYFL